MADGNDAPTPSVGRSWVTDDIHARRKALATPYAAYSGIEEMHEKGIIKITPQHEKVLLRAILAADASDLVRDVKYDARHSVAHEIIELGPGVDAWFASRGVPEGSRPKAGQHCFVVSAAADRLAKMDATVRLWTTHIEDVVAAWDAPKAG
jgi:hypothetical protein